MNLASLTAATLAPYAEGFHRRNLSIHGAGSFAGRGKLTPAAISSVSDVFSTK